ncbi:MAG: hypothetical protein ACI8TP_001738 [Acidimicrobiales bacterium]|jgi:hypothetical protein
MDSFVLSAQNELGEGRIDNLILDRSVHLGTGVVVLIVMTIATALVVRHAVANEPISSAGKWSIAAAQIALAVQVLIGIKLLDQGQGISQLYIHYVGGLVPMGVFLAGGWLARGDTGRSTRIFAALLAVGYVSVLMAFFIGRAYVNR